MTANVADNALLLGGAGRPDGLDARQHQARVDKYTEALRQGVKGLRIGSAQGRASAIPTPSPTSTPRFAPRPSASGRSAPAS
jgi:amidase